MKILIDLRWMVIGRAGGMEQMAFELVNALHEIRGGDIFYVYCPRRVFYDWGFGPHSKIRLIDSGRSILVPERVEYDRDQRESNQSLKRLGIAPLGKCESVFEIIEIDVAHSVGGYINDELLDYCNVLTVHDLQHLHLPQNFEKIEIVSRNARYLMSIRAAEAVISVSNFVKEDIVTQYGVPSERVTTIWNIPSGNPSKRFTESQVAQVLKEMSIEFDFLYFPSHGWPHKNHEKLVEAFSRVKKLAPELRLVFTGGRFDSNHSAAKKIRSLGLSDSVLHLGYRTPTEVRCLYQGAKALVYPSLFEGFGMPVAEAIESGTPVVCSHLEPLKEIGGNAVETFDPNDIEEMADKILKVVQVESIRDDLQRKGAARQKQFSPSRIARETHDVYRKSCGLDPVEHLPLVREPSRKRYPARHWGRLSERHFREGRILSGIGALGVTACVSPRLARSIWRALKEKAPEADIHLPARHGDGWIGPEFDCWYLVPEGASGVELDFEAPPPPYSVCFEFKVAVGGVDAGTFRFEGETRRKFSIQLPRESRGMIRIEIECSSSFKPSDEGISEDDRVLSMRLMEIRWIGSSR